MFRKIFIGFMLFFLAVVLAVGMLVTVSLAAVGIAVGSAVETLDASTVEVTDVSGNVESYTLGELLSETSRVEVTGDNGEQVTIDLNLPQITVQENGDEVSRVVIGGDEVSRIVIDGEQGFIFDDGHQFRFDNRNDVFFDGGFFGRLIGGIFKGLFSLAFWTLVIVGIVLILRNRQPAAEKTPDAVA